MTSNVLGETLNLAQSANLQGLINCRSSAVNLEDMA